MSTDIKAFEDECRTFLWDYVPFHKNDLFVAGGIFCRLYHKFPINDIDVYVKDKKKLQSVLKEYIDNGDYEVTLEEPDFVKLKHKEKGIGIDLIAFHSPKNMSYIQNFDFYHCMVAISENDFACLYSVFSAIEDKEIIVNSNMNLKKMDTYINKCNMNNPLTRLKKYMDLGFTIDNVQLTVLYRTLKKEKVK